MPLWDFLKLVWPDYQSESKSSSLGLDSTAMTDESALSKGKTLDSQTLFPCVDASLRQIARGRFSVRFPNSVILRVGMGRRTAFMEKV